MPLARHDDGIVFLLHTQIVSTHMPLARHDVFSEDHDAGSDRFYSHASCEAWHSVHIHTTSLKLFLLTCLLRGMTYCKRHGFHSCKFLLTCLLRGMTVNASVFAVLERFLLTCLLRGMTLSGLIKDDFQWGFYSHASCEAWRTCGRKWFFHYSFYSHASCEAWPQAQIHTPKQACFYSHASCEAWPDTGLLFRVQWRFYSHASCEAWQ